MTLPETEQSASESPPPKRIKLEETSDSTNFIETGLLRFCDVVLLKICSYLNPNDRFNLSQCCHRLQRIVSDRSLWALVDFRNSCITHLELVKYVKYFHPSTNIATKGPWNPPAVTENNEEQASTQEPSSSNSEVSLSFTGEMLEIISRHAPNLTTLILENHIIDAKDFTWDKAPSKLERLSLKRCHVIKIDPNSSYFFGIEKHLPNLKILDLCECVWFQSHSFLALSKCKQLQELRLTGCPISNFVPYVSLGTRFGFKALTVVDLRRTWVSDREVSCLNKTPTLRELYLESPGGEEGSTMISDLAITAFGGTLEQWNQMGYFVLLMPDFEGFMPSPLQVIQMCNYVAVTDTSLRHCASCLKGLKQLNVKGTSCTEAGVIKFKSARPDVHIESNFDLEPNTEPTKSAKST